MRPFALAVATLGGLGWLRPAPGTWASAAVLPVVWLGPAACLGLALLLSLVGWWALSRLPETAADPGWVVVDEGAGMALALAALPASPPWWSVLLAFVLFRLLDILKPGPVGWAERQGGSLGVMLDDLLAGAFAALLLLALRRAGLFG